MSICLANLVLQANAARSAAAQSQGIVWVPTLSPVAAAPTPVCVPGSIGIGVEVTNVNTVARVAAPHVEHVIHPALTIHVAHALLIAATRISLGAQEIRPTEAPMIGTAVLRERRMNWIWVEFKDAAL